jgi:hypothetical protein
MVPVTTVGIGVAVIAVRIVAGINAGFLSRVDPGTLVESLYVGTGAVAAIEATGASAEATAAVPKAKASAGRRRPLVRVLREVED